MNLARIAWALLALLIALPAAADELRPGYLELTQQDAAHWKMVWKAPVLGGLATHARPQVPQFCRQSAPIARLEGAALVAESELTCSRDLAGSKIGLAGMDAAFTDALLRVAPLGRPVQSARLTPTHAFAAVAQVPERWGVARSYFAIGVEHILTGYDHLLFVVALVLLLARLGVVVRAATAFTVAHSLTLAGTTLGVIGLAQAPVEALIALSIVFLAAEIIKQDPARPRLSERIPWLVAFGFGLIHGLGFAAALREIGLPGGDVPTALLSFNLGVEGGQLVIIAVTLSVLAILRSVWPKALRRAKLATSYAIGITASFWLIQRIAS